MTAIGFNPLAVAVIGYTVFGERLTQKCVQAHTGRHGYSSRPRFLTPGSTEQEVSVLSGGGTRVNLAQVNPPLPGIGFMQVEFFLETPCRQVMENLKGFPIVSLGGGDAVGPGKRFEEKGILPNVVGESGFWQGALSNALNKGVVKACDRNILMVLPEKVRKRHHSTVFQWWGAQGKFISN